MNIKNGSNPHVALLPRLNLHLPVRTNATRQPFGTLLSMATSSTYSFSAIKDDAPGVVIGRLKE